MSGKRLPDWPPIISGARPRWIVLRDIVITLCMWAIFLLILEVEFERLSAIRGELRPGMALIALLVSVLGISTLFSRRRRANALLLPQPSPVSDEELALDLGISTQQLETLRRQKIITIEADAQGPPILRI